MTHRYAMMFMNLLNGTLRKFTVPSQEKKEVIGLIESLRDVIAEQ